MTVTAPGVVGLFAGMGDAELVRRALAGSPHAFDALVDRHYARCLRYAARLLADRADAEEAVQDAFVRAHRALARYDEQDRFVAWLYRILVNRCRSYAVRRRGTLEFPTEHAQLAEHPAAASGDTADTLGLREELVRALSALDVDQREAFLLKHVDELSYEEMQAITGASVPALKMRVKRACDRLRLLLADVR
jgi:RNA polymerase sigma-70 factor (ECF subfamily)